MSKYDPNRDDLDDLLRHVDSILDDEEEDDWYDGDYEEQFDDGYADLDDEDIDIDQYSPSEGREDEPIFYQNYSNGYGSQVRNYRNGYGGQERPAPPPREQPSIPAYNADFHPSGKKRKAKPQQHAPRKKSEYRDYEYPAMDAPAPRPAPKRRRKGGCGCGCGTVLVALIVAMVGLFLWMFDAPESDVSIGDRKRDTATVLICGTDADGTRTDTMMLLYLSGNEKKAGLLSLPRDSQTVTASGSNAKLNSAYSRNGKGEEGMEGLMDYVENIIGYRPDGYILVDMNLVPRVVDIMGGVDVEVPQDMEVDGMSLRAGMQHLDGSQVLTLLRFRKGYATADLGRVEVQRAVLKACMDQWASLSHITDAFSALSVVEGGSISSLTTRNYLWMGKTLLTSLSGGFATDTLPGYADYIGDASYYILDLEEIADLINESYNPYEVTISPEDLSVTG